MNALGGLCLSVRMNALAGVVAVRVNSLVVAVRMNSLVVAVGDRMYARVAIGSCQT